MADEHEQLVKSITRQVEAALKGRGRVGEPSSAAIHPPVGICTGDYSKFQELKGRGVGAPPPATSAESPVFSGIVTAKQLESLGAVTVVKLDVTARLSPLAVDHVKSRKITVERVAAGGAKASSVAAASGDWFWWCDGHEPSVDRVADQLRDRVKPLSHQRSAGALVSVLKQLAKRVKSNGASGAVLFVDSAAKSVCLANRCPVLRAVVGTNMHAVEQGITTAQANVLVVEHPQHGWRAMRDMAERFITTPRSTCTVLEQQIKELSQCV